MTDRSSLEACLARVAAAGRISQADALSMLQQVADRAEKMRETGTPDPYVAAAGELAGKIKEEARADRLDALRNAAKRQIVMGKVTGFDNAAQTIRDALHGSNVGSRDNVQSEWLGNASAWMASVNWVAKKAGAWKAVTTGTMDRDIAKAMWARNAGAEAADVNAIAKTLGDKFGSAMDYARDRLNAAGARIGDAIDYAMHTWHDPNIMRRGGRDFTGWWQWNSSAKQGFWNFRLSPEDAFQRWWGTTEPKLAEKTFEELDPRAGESEIDARLRFGRSVFDALVSGVHMTAEGAGGSAIGEEAPTRMVFEGSRNIGRALSQQRVLFWKDADSWFDYNRQYGRYRTIYEGVQQTLNQGARMSALMERFGTNPQSNLTTLVRSIQEKYRDDLDGAAKFNRAVGGINNVMARLDGSANIPVNEMWYSLGEGARQWFNVNSLGSVGVTHFASTWATVPTELRHHGISAWSSMGTLIEGMVRGKGSEERAAILHDLGAYSDAYAYNLNRNWNLVREPGNTLMGRLSAMHSIFMQTTGIHYIFDNARAAVRETLAAQLGRLREKNLSALDPHLQQMLGKYGIGETEWEALRNVDNLQTWNGRTYITPRDALALPDEDVTAAMSRSGGLPENPAAVAKAIQEFRTSLADKLSMYYQDGADHSVVVPGVRERAALYGSLRPGDPRYEMARFLTQFKIWPLAAMNQILGREIHASLSKSDALWGIGLTLALTAGAGYMRMVISDVATGRPVRDFRRPETMLASLAQGGGIGILGDFLFGEASRMGSGLVATAGGPLASDADSLMRIYGRWRQGLQGGQRYNPWPDLAHLMIRHIPFANLVYLKGALDYMIWYHLLEASSPGWWDRTNRRLQKETGRTMVGYTPGGKIPWTPWGLGASQH